MATLTKRVITLMSPDLIARIERQAKIEKRSRNAFIRRVLERYIEDREFESGAVVKDAAATSMEKNADLLKKLEDS
ncbi:MAG: ribbon-helix-helix protein, CopG family [Candidatus Acidiferrales bacterium]